MDRQRATLRTFGTRDKKRHKRLVNIVAKLRRRQGVAFTVKMISGYLARRNQVFIRARRLSPL